MGVTGVTRIAVNGNVSIDRGNPSWNARLVVKRPSRVPDTSEVSMDASKTGHEQSELFFVWAPGVNLGFYPPPQAPAA